MPPTTTGANRTRQAAVVKAALRRRDRFRLTVGSAAEEEATSASFRLLRSSARRPPLDRCPSRSQMVSPAVRAAARKPLSARDRPAPDHPLTGARPLPATSGPSPVGVRRQSPARMRPPRPRRMPVRATRTRRETKSPTTPRTGTSASSTRSRTLRTPEETRASRSIGEPTSRSRLLGAGAETGRPMSVSSSRTPSAQPARWPRSQAPHQAGAAVTSMGTRVRTSLKPRRVVTDSRRMMTASTAAVAGTAATTTLSSSPATAAAVADP